MVAAGGKYKEALLLAGKERIMRKLRYFLVGLMALLLCLGGLQVYAEGDILSVIAKGTESSKEGGTIEWKFANVSFSDTSRFTVILTGNGSTLDYAPELCSSYNERPVAPWKTAGQGSNASGVLVNPGITSIGAYSFYGMSVLGLVDLPEGLSSIEDYAFANCRTLWKVYIPDSVTYISPNAFNGDVNALIYCSQNSYAHKYAQANGISFSLTNCSHESKAWTQTKAATCTGTGQQALKCPICGKTLETQVLQALGHDWGDWTTVSKATVSSPKKQERKCSRCSQTETRTVGSALTPAPVKVSSLKLTGGTTLLVGKKETLKLTVAPSNAANKTVTWSSNNKKYATVTSKGVVTAKAAGAGKTVTITAKAKDGSGKKASLKIKIKGAVTKITLKAPATLKVGKKATIKASVVVGKGGSKALTWSSSNKKYATVTSKGVVKALKAGKGKTVTITAKAKDGSGKKASVKIKLK